MEFLKTIQNIKGIDTIISQGGEIFVVGGIVRDFFLGVKSKDIDIVIRNMDINIIEKILSEHGIVKSVGKKFGILKFKPFGWNDEDIDIALPRTEKKISSGHKGFEIFSDHTLSLEADMSRRDITINSIAISIDGKIIDNFNGIEDIKNKKIKATSPLAFIEDPLRMIRAIRFSSIFDFDIEENTFNLIKENKKTINEISGERIIGTVENPAEILKIFNKGNRKKGIQLLIETGILEEFTGKKTKIDLKQDFSNLSLEDFFFILLSDSDNPSKLFNDKFKGETDIIKGIKAISIFKSNFNINLNSVEKKFLLIDLFKISNTILNSTLIKNKCPEINDFIDKKLPIKITELAIDGKKLKELGFKEGEEIGKRLRFLHEEVIKGNRKNIIEDLC